MTEKKEGRARKVVKAIGGVVVSVGVGAIMGGAIKHTNPEASKGITKLCFKIGALTLTSLVASKAVKHLEEQVDEVANAFQPKPEDSVAEEPTVQEVIDDAIKKTVQGT